MTVPYTVKMQSKYTLGVKQIEQLQFYLSDTVVLYKLTPAGSAQASEGKVVVHYDQHLEEIILRPGTPGVVVGVKQDMLLVSFEIGPDRFLIFGNRSGNGTYQLMAEEWSKGHGQLQYDGATYFTKPGAGKAHLEVQLRKLRTQAKETRIANGQTVRNR